MLNLDILLTRHHVFYNKHIADRLGILSSIFIQYLLDTKDKMKTKILDSGYFILCKQNIAEDTSMDDDKIKVVEEYLFGMGLIDIKPVKNSADKFYYFLNEDMLIKIIESPRDNISSAITIPGDKKSLLPKTRQKPISGRQQAIQELKDYIKETDTEIKEMYDGWVDGVYQRQNGFLSKTSINISIKALNEFCKENKKVKIEVLKIAVVHGLRDLNWAIESYQKYKTGSVNSEFNREELEANFKAAQVGGGQVF